METLDLEYKRSTDNDTFLYLLRAIKNKDTEFELIFSKNKIDKPIQL